MAQDPVCNMEVEDNDKRFTSDFEGKSVQFCSQECKEEFDKNPEEFSEAA